jgi:hypothetical protein
MIKSILLFEVLTLLYLIPELVYNLDLQYLTCVPPPPLPLHRGRGITQTVGAPPHMLVTYSDHVHS